ncbi:Carboxylesterase family protein [gamma proteobacterium HdN1]|nr:Carboxylesterase family protein [gamma proteobacterium HdN1]
MDVARKSMFATLGVGVSGARDVLDVAYGRLPQQKMDLYFPTGCEPMASVVFVHGGGWRTGDKREYRYLGRSLAARGYAVAVVGYRLFPEVQFPGFVYDIAQACVFLHERGASLGWPNKPFVLAGHSAGAHIASLVGLSPVFAAAFGWDAPIASGVIGLSGPYSFRPEKDPVMQPVFGPREHSQWHAPMCPIDCVGSDKPPMLLIHGTQDTLISVKVAQRMYQRALEAGQSVRYESLEGQGHYLPILAFRPGVRGHHHLMGLIDSFCLIGDVA